MNAPTSTSSSSLFCHRQNQIFFLCKLNKPDEMEFAINAVVAVAFFVDFLFDIVSLFLFCVACFCCACLSAYVCVIASHAQFVHVQFTRILVDCTLRFDATKGCILVQCSVPTSYVHCYFFSLDCKIEWISFWPFSFYSFV